MLALVMLTVFVCVGLYVGGRAFAELQDIPADSVTLTTLHDYWSAFSDIKKVKMALIGGLLIAILIPSVPMILLLVTLLRGVKRETYGSARFATTQEVRKARLLDYESPDYPAFVVGKLNDEFLCFYGQEFVALRAPTRAFKGVGCVIPNLLSYPHSVVTTDIKLENWVETAGYRAEHGQDCYLFAPTHEMMISEEFSSVFHKEFRTHRWNMLDYIRPEYEYRIGDTQSIGYMWWPRGGKDEFFKAHSRVLFLGLVLYVLETPGEPLHMPHLLHMTTPHDGSKLHEWIEATITRREDSKSALPRLSPECVDALRTYAALPDKTRGNVLSTFQDPLDIFRDPRLAAATSASDFDIREVRRKKMSIYIGMTPEDLMKYHTLMNVFFSQLLNENTRVLPKHDKTLKYQCALILDEFPALGRIEIIEKAAGYMAGYNMRLMLIYQNKGQLIGREGSVYGERGTQAILGNCAMKILYQPEDDEDAEEYSRSLGTQTVKSRSQSRTRGKAGVTTSESEHKRPLMLPQELKEMGYDKVIITSKLCKPVFAEKIMYFSDDALKDRAGLPPPPLPRMEIVHLQHRTRPLKESEVATIDPDDILNKAEILAAISKALDFDFTKYVVPATPANVSLAKAA
jgi:type IV secretion system protein VirD4